MSELLKELENRQKRYSKKEKADFIVFLKTRLKAGKIIDITLVKAHS